MLTPQQEKAVALLCTLPTQRAVASELGITEQTLIRWLKLPEFVRELRKAQRWVFREILQHVLGTQKEAIDTLKDQLTHMDPDIRQKAAKALLEQLHPAFIASDTITDLESELRDTVPDLGKEGEGEGGLPPEGA